MNLPIQICLRDSFTNAKLRIPSANLPQGFTVQPPMEDYIQVDKNFQFQMMITNVNWEVTVHVDNHSGVGPRWGKFTLEYSLGNMRIKEHGTVDSPCENFFNLHIDWAEYQPSAVQ